MQRLRNYIDIEKLNTFYNFDFAKNYVFSGEKHDFWELVYVDTGVLEVMADEKHYVLKAGQIIFHKPNEFHSLWSSGETAPNVVVVSFITYSQGMTQFNDKIFQLSKEQKKAFNEALKIAIEYIDKNHQLIKNCDIIEQLLKNRLEHFFLQLLLNPQEKVLKESLPAKERMEKGFMHQLIELMEESMEVNLCFQDLVDHINLSPSYIKRVFKEHMGISPMRFYREKKIHKAKKLIRESALSFTEIADQLGYTSVHYFSKQFKDLTGTTPTEYSKSVMNY